MHQSDPSDEPARDLLARIRQQRDAQAQKKNATPPDRKQMNRPSDQLLARNV